MRQLAALCQLSPNEVDGLRKPVPVGFGGLVYCYRCLLLNHRDVFSPYWRDNWVDSASSPCREHKQWVGYVTPGDMQQRRNLPRLLKMLERRWWRIEVERNGQR